MEGQDAMTCEPNANADDGVQGWLCGFEFGSLFLGSWNSDGHGVAEGLGGVLYLGI
jgi:hypothetical protein